MFIKKIYKLRKSFLRRFLFLIKKEKFFYKMNDFFLFLDLKDSIDREIYFNGYYEEEQVSYLKEAILKFNLNSFIDIGANIGVYALSISKQFPDLNVIAFEPHKDAFKRMEMAIQKNNFSKRITAYPYALANEDGEGKLFTLNRFDTSQSGGARISDEGQFTVKQKKGDDLIKLKDQKLAIKIDVEEFELQVLNGITELISQNKVFLQIEIFNRNYPIVASFLESRNFKLLKEGNYTHDKRLRDYFYINF
tara:strand:- start:214 stop:963 length:750 start_codon:yes stop_codon:yes gene_type:complete